MAARFTGDEMQFRKAFGPLVDAGAFRVTEAQLPVDSYENRDGYDPAFIDADKPLPLPGAGKWADDLVPLRDDALTTGADPYELKYTHFSVKMSKSRGLPIFSACNIDGKLVNRDIKRTDVWRRDPRIESQLQNLHEGYGDERQGLFSRGHMTRREDPDWGDKATATQADADTFHITNVAPQRQGFNAGIWLDLENYVLETTDRNDYRVTVITGPVISDDDPVYYNRRIPIAFWKVLAFVNGETGELTTLGYRRSQLTFLPRPTGRAFVFGDFDDTQISIASLGTETGLDLAAYAGFDVMAGADPGLEIRLNSVSDLYLAR